MSLLLYQWGNLDREHLTLRLTRKDKPSIQVPSLQDLQQKKDIDRPTTDKRKTRGDMRGCERLTKDVHWLVPPWGHHAIEKHGKDDLTETAPWMVPPWRWKTRRNEDQKDFKSYRPGDEQPTLQRWLVRRGG